MLTKADDYPIHQTAEPIAFAGTDRNYYDRYFLNGYQPTAPPSTTSTPMPPANRGTPWAAW